MIASFMPAIMRFFVSLGVFLTSVFSADAFSLPSDDGSSSPQSMGTLFDRFKTVCPADPNVIKRYSSSLIKSGSENDDGEALWAAVFRTSNNAPSVYVKDEFLQAMRAAVDPIETADMMDSKVKSLFEVNPDSSKQSPVAVACLRPSPIFDDCWVLDSMRCVLKKENQDDSCDGGSEHTEAISAAIDTLLVQYLSKAVKDGRRFDKTIRTKATLVSGTLLEERGFEEVQTLQKDMATHVSSFDSCMQKFAERSVDVDTKSPGARQRALAIVSYLGRLNREEELKASKTPSHDSQDDDFDPWAGVKRFL